MSKFSNPSHLPYYCVVGSPISHSLSPVIHQRFALSLGIKLCYERVEVSPNTLGRALKDFESVGGRGMNVTVPLKEEAIEVATSVTERAELAGAANTIVVNKPGDYLADNTDGVGLVTDLVSNLNISLGDKRVLILGAGGAVRGVIHPLIERGPAIIQIANRTVSKADNLVQRFHAKAEQRNVRLSASGYDASLNDGKFDVIINGTSLGLAGKTPEVPAQTFRQAAFCYDMMYDKSGQTIFTSLSLKAGAKDAADGLGMLVEQAAEAFAIWHGVRPDTAPVLKELRNSA
ncbi:MAG: shikimate dehydrogenase [Gammaproteobacteria bacterium]